MQSGFGMSSREQWGAHGLLVQVFSSLLARHCSDTANDNEKLKLNEKKTFIIEARGGSFGR
jgi:hypothetical protein